MGVGVFGAPAEIWKFVAQELLSIKNTFRWVDYNLVLRRSGDKVSLQDTVNLSIAMGVDTNSKKNHDFAHDQRYIGLIWSGLDHSLLLVVGV